MATLIGVPLSPFVRKIIVFCNRKNIPFDLNPMIPSGFPEGFMEKSPLGKIPVWQEEDFYLPDSSCIALYLEKKHPENPLYPSSLKEYAEALFLEEYADTRFMENTGAIFFEKVVAPVFIGRAIDQERVDRVKAGGLVECFTYLEKRVQGESPVVGPSFSIADIALGTNFSNLVLSGEPLDISPWPKVNAYLEWVLSQDGFRQVMDDSLKQLGRA